MRGAFVLLLAVVVAAVMAGAAQRRGSPGSSSIDAVRLLDDLRVLSADEMQGRQVGTPGGTRARAYIVQRFATTGVRPFGASYEQAFSFADRRRGMVRGANVIGRIDGSTPRDRYLVVSAHYDHVGVRDGIVYNGADDNASGTAALFALASYFNEHRPKHSIIFVAFDAEEAGMRGSRYFVDHPPVERSALALNLNVDMIGREPAGRLFVVGTKQQPFLRPAIERVATRSPVTLLMGHDDPSRRDVEDWSRDSDHYSFCRSGIPCLYFGVEDFSQHHAPTDDSDTIDDEFYVRAVETLVSVVEEFDAGLDDLAPPRGR